MAARTLLGLAALAASTHGRRGRGNLVRTAPATALATTLAALATATHRQRGERVATALLGRDVYRLVARLHSSNRYIRSYRLGRCHFVMILHWENLRGARETLGLLGWLDGELLCRRRGLGS